jgi:hypothetical protein
MILTKNQHPDTTTPKNTVINLRDHTLKDGTFSLLELELNYAVVFYGPHPLKKF